MTFRLVLDVLLHCDGVGATHTERAVPFLPRKCESMLSKPAGGVCLQYLDGLGQRNIRGQGDEQMRMICGPAGGKYRDAMVPPDTGEVFPQRGLQFLWNKIFALFGAEHAMDEKVGIFVRHGCRPGRDSPL